VTYEYACTACHHAWEREQRITAEPERDCPKCKQQTARRLIASKGAFVLNGSGWFRSGGY
jgi:putative FmdB family regulatory protein